MRVSVRLFASLRERAGSAAVLVDVRDDGATVADVLGELRARAGLADLLARMPVRVAVNREYADEGTPVAAGDELAVVPPVSGGSGDAARAGVHSRVTSDPLSLERLTELVGRPGAGAIVTFTGTTRSVERLEYEAYSEMAEERIAAILERCVERNGLEAAAAEHRTGSVPLGEASVAIAVSAAHRDEAFAGAREAIDRIKAEAPIWKREVAGASSHWVEGTRPASPPA